MKVCTCFLLFTVFATTHTLAKSDKQNSIEDNFLNVHNLLPRGKNSLIATKNERRDTNGKKVKTFTGFIQELIRILNSYGDDAFKDFFEILNEEIRKYHYRGCKFYEITENSETRRQLASKLELIRGKPVATTKAIINVLAGLIRDENYPKKVKEFVDYINSLYRQDGEEKFEKILSALENYSVSKSKRTSNTLVKIIKDAVRSVIFNHYTDLNTNARRELKGKIETFWNQFKDNSVSTSDATKFIPYTVATKNKINENATTEANETENETKEHLSSTVRVREENMLREEHTATDKSDEIFEQNQENSEDDSKMESNDNIDESKINIQSAYINSDKIPSGESFDSSSNSIEFSQERQREYNKQRYVTLFPEEITYKSEKVSKDADIVQRAAKGKNRKTRTTFESVQRMWVEESTGGIPKYIMNKYTTSLPKYKHESTSDESKVWSKLKLHKRKHEAKKRLIGKHHNVLEPKRHDKKKLKLKSKTKKQFKKKNYKHQKNQKHRFVKHVRTTTIKHKYKKQAHIHHKPKVVRYTKLDMFDDYKRGFDALRKGVDVNPREDIDPGSASIRSEEVWLPRLTSEPTLLAPNYSPPRIFKLRGLVRPQPSIVQTPQDPSQSRYSNLYELWDEHNYGDKRKSAAPPMKSGEGLSIEEFKRDREREYRDKSNRRSLSNDTIAFLNPNIIKKLNNLERELDAVKAKMNSSRDMRDINKDELHFMKDKDIKDDRNVKLVNEDNFTFKKDGSESFAKFYSEIVNKLHQKPPTTNATIKTTTTTKKIATNTTIDTTASIKLTTQTTTPLKIDKTKNKKEPLSDTVPLIASKVAKSVKKDTNVTTTIVDTNINNKTVAKVENDVRVTTMNDTDHTKDYNRGRLHNNVTVSSDFVNKTDATKIVSVISTITSKSRRMIPFSPVPMKRAINLGKPHISKSVW